MKSIQIKKCLNISKFIVREIGPYLVFFLLAHFLGERPALFLSIFIILGEYILLKYKKQKIGVLFYAFNSIILLFGFLELFNIRANIFQYEALLTNLVIALFWGTSIFKEKSVVQEIAESQGRTSQETSIDKKFFFDFFTLFWSLYFLSKGIFYFWMYQHPEIGHPHMMRFFIGKISFWIMMGISLFLPEKIWKMMNQMKILPSYRKIN